MEDQNKNLQETIGNSELTQSTFSQEQLVAPVIEQPSEGVITLDVTDEFNNFEGAVAKNAALPDAETFQEDDQKNTALKEKSVDFDAPTPENSLNLANEADRKQLNEGFPPLSEDQLQFINDARIPDPSPVEFPVAVEQPTLRQELTARMKSTEGRLRLLIARWLEELKEYGQ